MATDGTDQNRERQGLFADQMQNQMYLRCSAMILTGMVVMYFVMFVASWEVSHVRFSQSRIAMAIITMRSARSPR